MSLPIVIIFERHWDTIPKLILKESLSELSQRGYNTLRLEIPHNLPYAQVKERLKFGLNQDSDLKQTAKALLKQAGITTELSNISFEKLAEMMRLYVSSRRYQEVAEKIKNLPAHYIQQEIFEEADKLSISIFFYNQVISWTRWLTMKQ